MIFEDDLEEEANNRWASVERFVNAEKKENKLNVYETLWKYKGY